MIKKCGLSVSRQWWVWYSAWPCSCLQEHIPILVFKLDALPENIRLYKFDVVYYDYILVALYLHTGKLHNTLITKISIRGNIDRDNLTVMCHLRIM